MMKKIILHGHLAKKYPHPIVVEAATVAEAMRSLTTIEELTPPNGSPWPAIIRGVENEIALYSDTDMEEIHVYPRKGGSKKGGVLQVVLGITLIALAVVNPAFLSATMATRVQLFMTGGLLLTGGLIQMLSPTPKTNGTNADETSRYLGARGNTVKIGTNIPLAYGNNRLEGHYLSFDVDAKEWAGDAEETGDIPLVGKSVFVEYDKTPVATAPVSPVFKLPVASPTNLPSPAWSI